jgi:hypothetical protein
MAGKRLQGMSIKPPFEKLVEEHRGTVMRA